MSDRYPGDPTKALKASDLLGREVGDRNGNRLGRIADLVVEPDVGGSPRVVEAMVVRGPWGRLLGYEDPQHTGPWLLDVVARLIMRRDVRRIPWRDLVLADPTDRRTAG
ncbi:MAG TPA: PRC-barrel domain-containing protein [Micromonosporaceae bacterium]